MREPGKYKFISQLEPKILARAIQYARSMNALWKIRKTEFGRRSEEKIISLYEIIFEKKHEKTNLMLEYNKPKLDIRACGHHAKHIVQTDEGTAWCVMCECDAMNNVLEKLRTLLAPEGQLIVDGI